MGPKIWNEPKSMSKYFLNYNILLHIPMCYHFTRMLIMKKCVYWLLWLLRNQIESLNVSISSFF